MFWQDHNDSLFYKPCLGLDWLGENTRSEKWMKYCGRRFLNQKKGQSTEDGGWWGGRHIGWRKTLPFVTHTHTPETWRCRAMVSSMQKTRNIKTIKHCFSCQADCFLHSTTHYSPKPNYIIIIIIIDNFCIALFSGVPKLAVHNKADHALWTSFQMGHCFYLDPCLLHDKPASDIYLFCYQTVWGQAKSVLLCLTRRSYRCCWVQSPCCRPCFRTDSYFVRRPSFSTICTWCEENLTYGIVLFFFKQKNQGHHD